MTQISTFFELLPPHSLWNIIFEDDLMSNCNVVSSDWLDSFLGYDDLDRWWPSKSKRKAEEVSFSKLWLRTRISSSRSRYTLGNQSKYSPLIHDTMSQAYDVTTTQRRTTTDELHAQRMRGTCNLLFLLFMTVAMLHITISYGTIIYIFFCEFRKMMRTFF